MTYEIVTTDQIGGWTTQGIGDNNQFATEQGAETGIEDLLLLGPEWTNHCYGVRAVGSGRVTIVYEPQDAAYLPSRPIEPRRSRA